MMMDPTMKQLKISVDKKGIPRPSIRMAYPFHTLALWGHLDMLEKYVELAVDIDCRDKQGRTALHEACCAYDKPGVGVDAIRYLVGNGANVAATDSFGETPLHCLARHKKKRLAASFLVLECKAPLTWLNQFGQTPLDVAKEVSSSLLSSLHINLHTLTANSEHFEMLPEVLQFLLLHANPYSLRELSKERIMSQLKSCDNKELHQLPLPTRLKCYLGGTPYIVWIKEQENKGCKN